MERVFLLVYLSLTVLCFDTNAVYVNDPTLCSRSKCSAVADRLVKFKYLEGVTYRYAYSIDVSTNLGDKPEQKRNESTLQIDSVVALRFTSPCEGHLKLSDSSVSQNRLKYDPEFPDRAGAEFKQHLEQYPIRFAFQDGRVHEVCPHPKETAWVLNIKKGILSMFQNTMKRFDVDHDASELDINGICDTKYELHEARKTSLIVKKSKKISTCTNRYKYLSVLQSTSYRSPFSSNSHLFNEPLLKSWNDCEITIDHNIYDQVRCSESHMLKPLSNGRRTGARTDTKTSLKLIEEATDLVEDYETEEDADFSLSRRVNLLYDHAVTPRPKHGELRLSRECIKNMCRMGAGDEIEQEFSEMFTKLIHSTRLLQYPSLAQLLIRSNSICRTARKHIIDALPYIGSDAALMLQRDLIIRKQVPQDKVKDWVSGFALIPRPDRDTLFALAPLLDHEDKMKDSQFHLSYSAVIHAFCRNVDDCLAVQPVDRFLRHIQLRVQEGCSKRAHSPLEIKQTLEALKAIGNVGVETETLRDTLRDCIEGGGGFLTMETRVAAVDAHRRLLLCEETRDNYFLNVYRNFTQDTEIRIASYLQVMRCPDYNVIKLIKHTLKEEEVNQVGSFVWSHLTNLLRSSSPSRIEIQSLLNDRDLGIKFNSDVRKFSRNYESSFFSDEYNLGANYQMNVIFSPSSYIPRTATVNATVDVFGESINAFEISVRLEGMEYYAENFFGPDGPLSSNKVSAHFSSFLKSLRSTRSQNSDLDGAVKRLPNVIDNNFDNPRVSLALKMFGNDLQYIVLNGDKEIRQTLASLDPWAKFKQILSGREVSYDKTSMILDSTYVVPTFTGLPLRLGVSGSASCKFKMSGSLDSKRLTSNAEVEVIGNLMPSVSVDVSGTMVVDAFYKSAGIKLRSDLYSSGAVRGHLNVKGMELISLNLGLPNDKIEVFSILTDVLFISTNGAQGEEASVGLIVAGKNPEDVQQGSVQVVSNRTCTWPALDRLIGLKLCTDYQFSNVTKNPDASYFVLNGPALFKASLIKADPTAKSYLLEYRWQRSQNQSVIKVAFDTPGSSTQRELSAEVSFDAETRNVSVILKAAGSLMIAKGTYRRTDDEISFDLGLDINGTKHLDASAGYTRVNGHYGFDYSPRLYLAINNERVAELSGTIRTSEKRNVSQSDIDLFFETKKVWSRVVGYMMRQKSNLSANVKVEYQLEGPPGSEKGKNETVRFEISLQDHSQNTLTHKVAKLELESSAYPHLNVVMAAWYRQALGHLEMQTEINSNPHLHDNDHKLTVQLVLTNSRTYVQNEGAKISAYIAITKPVQKLDIKVGIKHYSHGPETNTHGLIRYAPGKEIMLIVNVKMPRGTLLNIEAHVNLTIPSFNPMLIDVDVKERNRKEYDLNLSGTWFSGHTIAAQGTYVDRSTLSIINHAIKLLLKSPSFPKDVIVNWKVYVDASDVKIDLQMEQVAPVEESNSNKYAIVLTHSSSTPSKVLSYVELRYESNVYTLTAKVDKEREARVEVHLDNWRDVHLIARGTDDPGKMEAGLEIKWDANRDPDLKFATSFQLLRFSSSAEKNVSTTVMVTYPGRLVTGVWLLALRAPNNYLSDIRLDWSPTDFIHFTVNADYNMQPRNKIFKIESQLLTPFELWRRTSLNARYLQNNNAITASTSVYWQDSEHLIIDLSADSKDDNSELEWHGNCGLVSTIHPVRWISGNITHKQSYGRTADSHLSIKYYPDKVVDLKSSWELMKDEKNGDLNITGTLNLISPLASYERGDVTCSFRFNPDWKVWGAVYVDLDKRKYTGNLVGDLARLKESMLDFNLTTPIARFSTLRGRLGFSEKNKHLVARIDGPHGSVGLEALAQLFTFGSDFNVMLEVATPIDLLQRTLLVAKLNQKEADFRVGYNNMTAGFQGVWRYANFTDFHYTYIVYTPLEGFDECGIVTKLVIGGGPALSALLVDTEFSLRLSDTKIGIAASGGPKPPPFVIPKKTKPEPTADPDEEEYDYEDDEDLKLYWQGQFLIDAAIFETIVGDLDLDQEEYSTKVLASLKIPPGTIRLDNRFSMEDYFHMKNDLKIDTPFDFGSEITSAYEFNVDTIEGNYLVATDLRIKNQSHWIQTGYLVTGKQKQVDDLRTHTITVKIITPLRFMPHLDGKVVMETEDHFYTAKVNVTGEDFLFDLHGSLETDDGLLDSMMVVKVNSPRFVVPKTKLVLKKDLTAKENRVEFGVEVYEPVLRVFNLHGVWHVEGNHLVNASVVLKSPIEMLEDIKASVYHVNWISKNDSAKFDLVLVQGSATLYKLTGDYKEKVVSINAVSPIRNYENLEYLGNVIKVSDELFKFDGDLTTPSSGSFRLSGEVRTRGESINSVRAMIAPAKNSQLETIDVNFNRKTDGFKIWSENGPRDVSLDFSYENLLNWNVEGKIHDEDNEDLDYHLTAFVNAQANGNLSAYLHAETPLESIETLTIGGNMLLTKVTGTIRTNHRFNRDSSDFQFEWGLLFLEDMRGRIVLGYEIDDVQKHVDTQLFLKNPRQSFRNFNIGFDVNVDHEAWRLGSNVTVGYADSNNLDAIVALTLPPPDQDSHTILISYHDQVDMTGFNYAAGYRTEISQLNYASDGSYKKNPQDINGHLRVTWGMYSDQTVNNLFNITFQDKEIGLDYSLITPKFAQEETLVLRINYITASAARSVINADVYYPSTKQVGNAHVFYTNIANLNGSVNATTPFPGLQYAGCKFAASTTIQENKRLVELFWPGQTALLNSEYSYHSERLDSSLEGILHIEVPLNTRHEGHLTYGYKKRPQITTGHSELTYNGDKIVHGEYNSKSESRAGFEKDRTEISIQNSFKPLGIVYVNQYEYSAGNEGTNYPTVELKQVNVYRLDNSSAFNIVGESRIRTTHSGQDIDLKAVHLARIVQLHADYKILPGEFDHNSRLSLAPDAWASYHVNILNKTTEDVENQYLVLNFAYPKRNFTLDGSYSVNSSDFNSEAKLEWDNEKDQARTIGAGFKWNKVFNAGVEGEQQAVLSFRHPSFEKDVTLAAKLDQRDVRDWVNVGLVVDYSTNPEKLLVLSGKIRDDSVWPDDRKYSYQIIGQHPSTFLSMHVQGSLHKHAFKFARMENHADYRRGSSALENGQLYAYIDLPSYEIKLRRDNKKTIKFLKARYYTNHPEHVLNGSMIYTPEINATGSFYLNIDEKLTWLMVNYTPDAVESLRMYGKIPDARNAVFDIWRTYDQGLKISDVAFYLRLNHSRLVTSTLQWRPDLKEDITNTIKSSLNEAYQSVGNDVDYWKQYVRGETVLAISDVWKDAQKEIGAFVDDWNNLKDLQEDFDHLKVYLNNSYNANEFYVRDIVAFGSYLIDELSLRNHIQSLPNIFNEIWDIMGESGLAVRNSLLWAIEGIKSGYNKLSEIVIAIMKGDSMAQIATIVEKLVEKYDNFVKDLHVTFIKYMESLWGKISVAASDQWKKFLEYLEPMFVQVLHYLETVVWKASKEVLDFLYDRKTEIMTSPYFDRFTNFTQDIDKIYKDIKAHDLVTNVRKYSGIIIQFIKERYFTMVPFGKELKNVINEITSELQELTKLPSASYAIHKLRQLYAKIEYLYDYFDVGDHINRAILLVHTKLTDISQTALQAEDRYREAKTKFIFSPQDGLLCLEQKLPMSWHAFNQTPEFQEIAEYRAVSDLRSYFVTSNMTFWTLYYQYRPYTEPSSWLPPFKAQAMIAGGQHYMTFDGRYYEFSGECTYLLAQDFIKHQFAVLIKYDVEGGTRKHQIVVLIGGKAVQLDVLKNSVKLLDSEQGLQLPAELGNGEAFVYQEENIVVVESPRNLFRLECNTKFDLCLLELSGWYYGKTAGLFGTMSNEQADDFLRSDGGVATEVGPFARSWSLDKSQCTSARNRAFVASPGSKEPEICEELFVNQSSEFNSCFNVVNPGPYRSMCANSPTDKEACTVAVAYIQVCLFHNTYLRIPDHCTRCRLANGTEIKEGDFPKLEGNAVPKSSDIVFIVEAKDCSTDIKKNSSLELLVPQLNKEFSEQGLKNLRWSLVTFGGDGVYNKPRSLVIDGETFTTDHKHFLTYFDHIPTGNGNQDIFAALKYAAQLEFRAGVSKTFILLACSHCDAENQTLDYSVLHQVLLEHDTTLHILMDGDFELEKAREGKFLYGLDADNSYTRKDTRVLTGDKDLRRQVKLSKSILGYCTPLALETNGTVFSGKKLRLEKPMAIKKIANVFSKRVAASAQPSACQHCECVSDNDGMTRMECIPCIYPTPVVIDYDGFDENESLAVLQPFDADYQQSELEKE